MPPAMTGTHPVAMTVAVRQYFDLHAVPTETFRLRTSGNIDIDLPSPNLAAGIVHHVLARVLTGAIDPDARAKRQNVRVRGNHSGLRRHPGCRQVTARICRGDEARPARCLCCRRRRRRLRRSDGAGAAAVKLDRGGAEKPRKLPKRDDHRSANTKQCGCLWRGRCECRTSLASAHVVGSLCPGFENKARPTVL